MNGKRLHEVIVKDKGTKQPAYMLVIRARTAGEIRERLSDRYIIRSIKPIGGVK
jgi:hypothetical protein